ncbi:MAG: DUF86 domain-containing protein [Candidatus Abyssubacteria bacterium]
MWRDDAYLLDILIAARHANEFMAGLSREEFDRSRLHQDAVVKELEIIGEATRKLSRTFKKQHSEIPWHDLTAMRNRLIHEYFRIDVDEVWEIVTHNIPELIRKIEPLVPPE